MNTPDVPAQTPKCSKKECKNPGVWMPILEFRAGHNAPPSQASLNLPFCQSHKESMTPEDLLSDEGFKQVCKAMEAAGRMRPLRDLTTLTWYKAR